LTDVTYLDGLAVHAEQWRPGGELLRGDSPELAERSARLYAQLAVIVEGLRLPPPLPNPEWVNWDHDGPGIWPPNELHDNRPLASQLPPPLVAIAGRARARLAKAAHFPRVLGHADWETQNLRWDADGPHAVHDWDSLAWQPEAALVGAASGAFASSGPPTLAPIAASEAFLAAYQDLRGRAFTTAELEVAWAASLWTPAHNARWEALHGDNPLSGNALRAQADERLRRARA